MSEEEMVEFSINPLAFEFLKRCLLMVATSPLTFSEDKRLAGELYDMLKEEYGE